MTFHRSWQFCNINPELHESLTFHDEFLQIDGLTQKGVCPGFVRRVKIVAATQDDDRQTRIVSSKGLQGPLSSLNIYPEI